MNSDVISDDQITAIDGNPANSFVVDTQRGDRVDPLDRLPRAHLAENYAAQHWRATWIGFDTVLLALMIATAVLGFLRRHVLTLFAFTTGVLLVCDAWFDVMTARRGDMMVSVLTAALGELPWRSSSSAARCGWFGSRVRRFPENLI